jgi:hypothetical protein
MSFLYTYGDLEKMIPWTKQMTNVNVHITGLIPTAKAPHSVAPLTPLQQFWTSLLHPLMMAASLPPPFSHQ